MPGSYGKGKDGETTGDSQAGGDVRELDRAYTWSLTDA